MRTHTTYGTHDERRATNPITRHLPTAARILFGLIFAVMGLNGFLNFLPQPSTPVPERAVAFLGALYATGYMIQLVSGTQLVVGVLVLTNRFVPLALALIAPVIVNIVAVHAFLVTSGIGLALVVLALELYLAWAYRDAYRPMVAMRAVAGLQQDLRVHKAPTATSRKQISQDTTFQLDDWFEAREAIG